MTDESLLSNAESQVSFDIDHVLFQDASELVSTEVGVPSEGVDDSLQIPLQRQATEEGNTAQPTQINTQPTQINTQPTQHTQQTETQQTPSRTQQNAQQTPVSKKRKATDIDAAILAELKSWTYKRV